MSSKVNIMILVAAFIFSNCSSDGDENQNRTVNDPFVGQWYYGLEVYKLDNGNDFNYPIENCQDEGYLVFNSDGTALNYDSNEDTNGNCIIELSDNIQDFSWENIGNGQYRLSSTEVNGTQSTSVKSVVFVDQNTMYWVDEFPDGYTVEGQECSERWSYFHK